MESYETNNIKINKQIHLKSMDKYKLKLSKTIFDNKVYVVKTVGADGKQFKRWVLKK
jgi:hypothetical protein